MRFILFILLALISFSSENLFCQVTDNDAVPPIDVEARRKADEDFKKQAEYKQAELKKKLSVFNRKYKTNYTTIYSDLGKYWVVTKEEKKGLIEVKSGKTIVPFSYSDISFNLEQNTFVASEDGSAALYDLNGKELIPYQKGQHFNSIDYDTSYYFFLVSDSTNYTKDGHWSGKIGRIFSQNGQFVAKNEFSRVKVTHQKYLLTEKNELWGLMDSVGRVIFDNQFTELNQISVYKSTPWKRLDTIFVAKRRDNKVGLVSLSGNIIMPFEYTYIGYGGCNLIGVVKGFYPNRESGYYDLNFNLVIPFSKDRESVQCNEGFIIEGNRMTNYGYIDSLGKIKIPLEYTDARVFENGLAIVKKDNKFGIIDKNNRIVLPFIYDGLGFSNEFLSIRIGKRHGVLDSNYKTLIPMEFDNIHFITGFDGIKYFEVEMGEDCFKYNDKGEKIERCKK